jgi:hypothetical protein
LFAVAALAATAGLSACEPPDGDQASAPGGAAGASTTPPEVVVTAADYSFSAPAEVPAGMTQLTIDNTGKELHHIALYRLAEGKGFEDFAAATASNDGSEPLPEWVVPTGGPNAAMPGARTSSFVDLEESYYVLLCGIPDAEGTPHFQLGMVRPLRVGPAGDTVAEAPEPDATIQGTDFAFGLESSMTAGDHVINFENNGQQPHELTLFKLDEGAEVMEIPAAFAPGGSGRPPATAEGGVVEVAPGDAQSFPVALSAGRYGVLCFLTDPASGKMHFELGMAAEFEVE